MKGVLTAAGWEDIPGIIHGFGTREFGSDGLRSLAAAEGFRPVFIDQIHSGTVHVLSGAPAARPRGDALASDRAGLLLVVRTADCLPLLLADARGRAVAAVHAGWRGTLARIAVHAARALIETLGCPAEDMRAALGPCIGPGCFEIGPDVRRAFRDGGFDDSLFTPGLSENRWFLDLARANALQLLELGVPSGSIVRTDLCPHCRPDFHSFRRDRSAAGRLLSFIGRR